MTGSSGGMADATAAVAAAAVAVGRGDRPLGRSGCGRRAR